MRATEEAAGAGPVPRRHALGERAVIMPSQTVAQADHDVLPAWRLPRAVHACSVGDRVIFLDLVRDRYRAAPAGLFAEMGISVGGVSVEPSQQTEPGAALRTALCAAGLVEPCTAQAPSGLALPVTSKEPARR